MCGQLGVAHSGVETMDVEQETLACLCATDAEFAEVTTDSSDCTACADGTCGGVDGAVFTSPSAEDLAELTVTAAPEGATIEVGDAVTLTGRSGEGAREGGGSEGEVEVGASVRVSG